MKLIIGLVIALVLVLVFWPGEKELEVKDTRPVWNPPGPTVSPPGTKAGRPGVPVGGMRMVFTENHPSSRIEEIVTRLQLTGEEAKLTGHHYTIAEESFQVYVPSTYKNDGSFGLLVYTSPSDSGKIPVQFQKLIYELKLVWVGADKAGNAQYTSMRRLPLALDAVHNMQTKYKLDPDRVWVLGFSGGGRVASKAALHFPDVFKGGVFVGGMNYWEPVQEPGPQGQAWDKTMNQPLNKYLNVAKHMGRYVALIGGQDPVKGVTRLYAEGYKKHLNNVLYLEVPLMEHTLPAVEDLQTALNYCEGVK